jgi:hypothetical protein
MIRVILILAVLAMAGIATAKNSANLRNTFHVKATREGLIGHRTATGHAIIAGDVFM